MKKPLIALIAIIACTFSYAQTKTPKPDLPNVTYGEHERNVLDIWFADKNKQTPLAIYTSTEAVLARAVKKKSMEMS